MKISDKIQTFWRFSPVVAFGLTATTSIIELFHLEMFPYPDRSISRLRLFRPLFFNIITMARLPSARNSASRIGPEDTAKRSILLLQRLALFECHRQ